MRINHNIESMTAQSSLYKNSRDMSKSLERLSTGLRINRASDDAAGLGVSEKLRVQVRGTAQAMRNAQDGIAAITIAEGAANEISDTLQRLRELAVQASNDTLTSTERGYVDKEYTSLVSEIDRISTSTNYNGMKLIGSSGTSSNARFGYGTATQGSALWIDSSATAGIDSITITIDTLTTTVLKDTTGTALSTTRLTSQTNANQAIQVLDSSIGSVNTMRSTLGSYINRLDHAINNLTIANTNQQAAESQIRDADFAKESSTFTRNQILNQSGTAMLAQSNQNPQSVLQLIR